MTNFCETDDFCACVNFNELCSIKSGGRQSLFYPCGRSRDALEPCKYGAWKILCYYCVGRVCRSIAL